MTFFVVLCRLLLFTVGFFLCCFGLAGWPIVCFDAVGF